ncbi:MAG: hypothetical protein KKB13_29405, partial [Chloroflexi bacterium]|nr:hypothetical protein [Chloroflexota bacterium]
PAPPRPQAAGAGPKTAGAHRGRPVHQALVNQAGGLLTAPGQPTVTALAGHRLGPGPAGP